MSRLHDIVSALQGKLVRLNAELTRANEFESACYKSAFGFEEAVIDFHGIQYVADRSDFYDAVEASNNIASQVRDCQEALKLAEENLACARGLQRAKRDDFDYSLGSRLRAA